MELIGGDTPWFSRKTGTGSLDSLTAPGEGAAGARRLVVPASSTVRLSKGAGVINLPDDGAGLLMSARVRMDTDLATAGTSYVANIGFGHGAVIDNGSPTVNDVGVYFSYPGTGLWSVTTTNGVARTTVVTAEAPVANTWQWLDILVVSNEWAAFWVDGSGPYVVTTDVPAIALSLEPFFYCLAPAAAATAELTVDVIDISLVNPVASPAEVLESFVLADTSYLLLETGDGLLLETGYSLLKES